jgi:hypothetical protein
MTTSSQSSVTSRAAAPPPPSQRPVGDGGPGALSELLAAAVGQTRRDDPIGSRTGGPAGNARLTAWTGLILLVFFLAETATLVSVGSLITVHILIGAFLVPLILLKTVTTGWRIARYYVGSADYRQAGPPPLLLRLLGPIVVLTSLAIVGSGLALIALGHAAYTPIFTVGGFSVSPLTIHQASFIAWAAATVVHLLARTVPAIKLVRREPRHAHVPGARLRACTIVGAVTVGVVVGLLVLHLSGDWTQHNSSSSQVHGRFPGTRGLSTSGLLTRTGLTGRG